MASSMCKKMAAVFNMKTIFVAVIAISFTFIAVETARLSDPKILLPYHTSVITNFTLNINLTQEESRAPSCYTWRSSRLDVATIQLINSTDNECAFAAEISAVSKSSIRKTSIVIAENKVSGEILKCIVIVDSLQRIEIETTTRLLYLEDSPEELMIRGYDAEGNVFSSLRGLEFQWSLHSDTQDVDSVVDANSILRILKFSESYYTTPFHIDVLEEKGRQGDIILVEGVRTGSAYVWAKVREEAFEQVPHSSVRLMVIANLMVSPPEAYVLKYATVKYKVEQIKQSSVVEIKMPSAQFFLEVQEKMICTLDARTSVATAQELGDTEIKLIDKNIQRSDVIGQPSAILHVVSPSYLGFVVLPDRKWVLESGREYEVLIEVYDKNSHKLYPSDNVIISALFPSQYFQVLHSSKNGTFHHVLTLQKGDGEIDGTLASIIRDDGTEFVISPTVKQAQHFEIYDPIDVDPAVLFFPWDPVVEFTHRYPLSADGGSGEYVWSSSDVTVATVNKNGEITTAGRGDAVISAADKRNQLHVGTAVVHVVPPSGMDFQPDRVEMVVGSVLEIPLQVSATYKGRNYAFHDCREMPLNMTFSDPSVFQYIQDYSFLVDGSCRTIKVKAIQQGHTKVKATYNHGRVKLQTSVTIAAYDQLVPVDPEKEAVVTVGASKEIIFSGGPQPWVLDSSKYFQILTSESSSNVVIDQVNSFGTQRGQHSFYVACKNFGEQMLILRVGNEKTAKNNNPAVEEASVSFVCAEPVELHLEPKLTYPQGLPPCPVAREPNQPIPVHCDQDLDLLVTVTDSHGRRFDNVSSLEFDWQLSDESLASIPNTVELESDIVHISATGRKKVTYYQTLQPLSISGSLVVTVSVSRYRKKYLQAIKSNISDKVSPKISKSIELRLVEEAVVSPNQLSVFNHPSNKVTVAVEKGSGYFHIVQEREGIVDLKYLAKKKQLEVSPLRDGSLTVIVYDLCIDSRVPASAALSVSGVGSVQLHVMDKVEVGKDITARVQVLDASGQKLYSSFFQLMGLRLEPASDLVTVKPDLSRQPDEYTALYTVHGAFVGHTSLKGVTYLSDGKIISSQPKPVEVFPPLELIPRNITLIIGALFQVLSRGGPRPQCTVVFTIRNSDIATVSSSGLLDAQALGTTRVVGQAVGQDPETGETVIYSQDEVIVNVVRLAGIRIHAPLTRLQTDTTMPVFAVGLTEHETPFTFGSAFPPLSFKWSVNNKDVAKLQNVFYKSGIQPQSEGNFAVQMVAMETGHVSVRLEVRGERNRDQIVRDSVLRDELQIQVFTKLAMISPSVCSDEVLMTPYTDAHLKTNRDGSANMIYTVNSADDTSVVTVTEDGILQTGSGTGEAALHITAQEEFGINQTVVLLVKVKPVSYMMINSDTAVRTSGGQLATVPRGTTLRFTVTYHDDVGEQFYATNVHMKYRCSRYDLVQVSHGLENNTLVMKTAAIGQTVLKVWDKDKPWLVDFISIPVGDVIAPSEPRVLLGSVVCFSTPIVSTQGYSGSWFSNKGLMVDPETGLATASSVGATSLVYTVSDYVATETEVYIEPIRMVSLETEHSFITNAGSPDEVYNVYLSFGGQNMVTGDNCSAIVAKMNYHPAKIPVSCDLSLTSPIQGVSLHDLFTVSAVFIPTSGRYACRITPRQLPPSHQMSVLGININLRATVLASKDQPEAAAPVKSLQYLPPFYVHNTEIHVSTMTPLTSIRLSVFAELVNEIEVVVSDTSILEVLQAERDSQSKSVISYPVRLLDTISLWEREQLDIHIDLICQKTGQKVRVPVYIRLIGQKPDVTGLGYSGRDVGWRTLFGNLIHNYQYWFILVVIMLVTALTVIFAYHAMYGPRYKTAAVVPPPGFASPQGSPVPPQQISPAHMQSPQTTYDPYNMQTPKSPLLWSTYSPLSGVSPTRQRRSPIQRISPP